jgi:DNA ligase (NAD+)
MLSLEKATTPEQVAAFFARFPGQPVVVMPKLDGLSLAVVYEDGGWRGRSPAATGRPATTSRRWCARWPTGSRTGSSAAAATEVRGELVMLRSTFAAYNAEHPTSR